MGCGDLELSRRGKTLVWGRLEAPETSLSLKPLPSKILKGVFVCRSLESIKSQVLKAGQDRYDTLLVTSSAPDPWNP